MNVDVNYLAVLVAAVVNMAIGYAWYGPLFGKKWIALMQFTPESMAEARNKGMTKSYLITFVGALVMAYVLYHTIAFAFGFMQVSGAVAALSSGFWMWLGFVMPVTLGKVIWEGKSWPLWAIDNGYYLALLLINSAIIGAWM